MYVCMHVCVCCVYVSMHVWCVCSCTFACQCMCTPNPPCFLSPHGYDWLGCLGLASHIPPTCVHCKCVCMCVGSENRVEGWISLHGCVFSLLEVFCEELCVNVSVFMGHSLAPRKCNPPHLPFLSLVGDFMKLARLVS